MKTLLHRLIHDERGFWNFLLPLISGIGGVLGGASKSSAEAKQQQNQTAISQYQSELAAKMAQQQAATNRAQDIRTAPQDRLKQQLTANMIQGWKPTTISHPRATIPQMSGGPPAFDQTTMAHAGLMSRDALLRQLQGQGASDITPSMTLPNAPQMAKSSWLDKVLGIGGLAGGIAGAIGQRKPQTPPTQSGINPNFGGWGNIKF